MGDVAASGGYFISCGADTIFAQPATLTGSIGVVFAKPVFAGAYEKYGIERTPVTSHPHADANTVHRAYTPEEKEWLANILSWDYNAFLDIVAEARRIPRPRLEELAQGRVYTGAAAKSLGLVDELGSLDDAVAYARREADLPDDAPIEYVGPDGRFWRRLPAAAATLFNTGGF